MQSDTQTKTVSQAMTWTGRVISAICVLFLLFDGVIKVMKLPIVLKACVELGIPTGAIQGIGIVLVASTLLYAIPVTSVLGAILLTGYLGGAVSTHVRTGGPAFNVAFATIFGMLVWLGLFLQDARLHTLLPLRTA